MGRMSLIDKYNNLISKIESLLEELEDVINLRVSEIGYYDEDDTILESLQETANELKISLG